MTAVREGPAEDTATPPGVPLTVAQTGIWFGQALDPGNPIYTTGERVDLHGPLDVGAFAVAVRTAIDEADLLAPGAAYTHAEENLARLHEAGATVVAGTDANDVPGRPAAVLHGASMHLELELLVRAGLTPTEALAAATSRAADTFALADRGRIVPGRRADLLLVEGDPLTDVTATRDLRTVWRGGVAHDLSQPRRAHDVDVVGRRPTRQR